jgi:hypothetical protein
MLLSGTPRPGTHFRDDAIIIALVLGGLVWSIISASWT